MDAGTLSTASTSQRTGLAVTQVDNSTTKRLAIKITANEAGKLTEIGAEDGDHKTLIEHLQIAFGTRGMSFPLSMLNQVIRQCRLSNGEVDRTRVNAILAVVDGAKPANEMQAMLALQMALTHVIAAQLLDRAARAEHIRQCDSAGALAVKLMRTFTAQAEALAKLQRGGEQTVRVVHVHPGGQAVVGNVVASAVTREPRADPEGRV